MGLTFFGLTPSYRLSLFSQIHDIVFHGKGGYDWHTIYNMPIWLRNFTFNKVNDFYIEENKAVKKAQGKNSNSKSVTTDGKVTAPEFLKHAKKQPSKPTYSTKASKK